MIRKTLPIILLIAGLLITSCNEDDKKDLKSADQRVEDATEDLIDELTDPSNGWKVSYQPTNSSGVFLLFLNFDDEGNVNIRSDVGDEGGIYLDQNTTYQVSYGLGTELVFDTYGVLHYLFEKNQSTFGAEFEFYFREKDGDDLIFESKSDGGDATEVVFEPAQAQDFSLLSSDLIAELSQGTFQSENLAGVGILVQYQVYLESQNISMFITVDLDVRRLKVHGATVGNSRDEIISSTQNVSINHETAFSLLSGSIVFDEPVSFSLAGQSYTISDMELNNFQTLTTSYCAGETDDFISFDGNLSGIGDFSMLSSLISSHSDFIDEEGELYQVNPVFIFDENDSSYVDRIDEVFEEDILAFILVINDSFNGFTREGTFTGLGFVSINDNNQLEWFMREMNIGGSKGNFINLELTDGTFINVLDSMQQRDALFQLTDEIFSGGELYALEVLSIDGLFELYNPCNRNKVFLF
ncbi:MAG: DUF4302 domain-containing protein [Cyclobacteriaceae bacterium]